MRGIPNNADIIFATVAIVNALIQPVFRKNLAATISITKPIAITYQV